MSSLRPLWLLPSTKISELSSDERRIALYLDLALKLLQHCQAPALLLFRNRVAKIEFLGARARRILERENLVVTDLFEKRKRFLKLFLRFSGKPDDDIGG